MKNFIASIHNNYFSQTLCFDVFKKLSFFYSKLHAKQINSLKNGVLIKSICHTNNKYPADFISYNYDNTVDNKNSLKIISDSKNCQSVDNNLHYEKSKNPAKKSPYDGPNLRNFLIKKNSNSSLNLDNIPYVQEFNGNNQKVYLEIFGCQMNVNDAEIVAAILKNNNYEITVDKTNASIILLITCAIRDSAEKKIWNKLNVLKQLKMKKTILKIGILGCMAERLKQKIVEKEKLVDLVAGPDSYKDLPRLLAANRTNEFAINVALSFDETYADVTPIRLNPETKTAYVSIMRGCDNMCTYCIVPFTRGKERSRPVTSILNEIRQLSDQGIKEITLLGQNVNSYRDSSDSIFHTSNQTVLSKGFHTVYKSKQGGLRFADLLDKVSLIDSEIRIRFTSPHPKDFPDEVLHLIAERKNICKHVHLPAQSGSTEVLKRMRRGYTREAYLNLVDHIRETVPEVAISSDFIAGFCDETEEEFDETLSLIKHVKYSSAFLFAYSMREKTTAYRRFTDNIDKKVKIERLQKMIKLYRMEVEKIYKDQIGQKQLVLVEGESKRSTQEVQGRNDGNIKVIFPKAMIRLNNISNDRKPIKNGEYIAVQITSANSQVLKGIPLYHSTIQEFFP